MVDNVGLIGFGIMGQTIAKKLIDNGYSISLFDIDLAATARAERVGCKICNTPSSVALDTSIILISLPAPEHVRSVICDQTSGILSTAKSGSVIVDTSTIDPKTTKDLAAKARAVKVGYLDAPVLGRPMSVGNWTLPTGGLSSDLEKAKPVLDLLAEKIVLVGPSGDGNKIKLLNNLMFGTINAITCEVFAFCKHLNIDTNLFFNTVSQSSAGTVSNLFKELGPKIVNQDFLANFSINNLNKDMQLGLEMAKQSDARLPISEGIQAINALGKDTEIGAEDTSALVKIFEKLIMIKDIS